MLFHLFFVTQSKRPAYRIDIVDSKSELPKNSKYVQIPGYDGGVLICAKPNTPKAQRYKGEVSDVLAKFSGKCIKAQSQKYPLEFCFEGESKLGNLSLGHHNNYTYFNKTLTSISTGGSICNETTGDTWSLKVEFQCDNAIWKEPLVPAAWTSNISCQMNSVVKTSKLCKHIEISSESVYDVKCIRRDAPQVIDDDDMENVDDDYL